MQNQCLEDAIEAVNTDHPARPYLLSGAVLAVFGLLRPSLSGVRMLGLGAALVGRGMEEVTRVKRFHGGNHHGINSPPANR